MAKTTTDPLGIMPKGWDPSQNPSSVLGGISAAAIGATSDIGGVFKDAWNTPGPVGKILSVSVGALAGYAIGGAAGGGSAGTDAAAEGGASSDIVPVEAGAGASGSAEAAANLGTVDATGGIAGGAGSETLGGGPGTDQLAAAPATPDTTTNLATNTANSDIATTPQAALSANTPAPASTLDPNALQAGQYVDPGTGSVVTPGPGTGAADVPQSGGLISNAMQYAHDNPLLTATGVSVLGNTVAGAAAAAKQQKSAQEQAQIQLDNQEALQQFNRAQIQSGSAGGAGVNVNVRPASKVLRRPDGSLVYANNGLIAGALNKG